MSTVAALFILSPYIFGNGLVNGITATNDNATFKATADIAASPKQGWTSEPDGRGTLSILWSCSFTMFLCSWSILFLNVPSPNDTQFQVFRRKLYMTTLSFLGPEFIFQIALGQWVSARQSVREFEPWILARNASRGPNEPEYKWTMEHAFFADMGGFVLHTTDNASFPIDAKQLHYLVTEGHLKFPKLDERMIADRNKADGAFRIVTLFQILWFVINLCGRAAQQLAITCVELTTAAFIVCSVGILFCWAQKPSDVAVSETLESEKSLEEILAERMHEPYRQTPLDFISRKEWPWSLYWSNWINILRNLGIVFAPPKKPVDRFENTIARELSSATERVFLGVTTAYLAIFICGWNYTFPSPIEQTLWRISSITMMGSLIAYWAISEFVFSAYPRMKKYASTLIRSQKREQDAEIGIRSPRWPVHERFVRGAKHVAACIRNNSVDQDPALDVPLKAILPMYVVCFFYCCARTYIFVADAIEFRSLPASTYATVNWSVYFPHF